MLHTTNSPTVAAIDWPAWVPTERAVLCFVQEAGQLLLIHKKTGLGTGKVNAPGGRIEPGETAMEAAVRETMEEVGVTPSDLQKRGELFFEFTNGYKLHGTVFFALSHTGEPHATIEADPFWCAIDQLPYDQMWEDDRYWLPLALAGRYFCGYFIFDDDVMLDRRIDVG
jgi:8-oxo-dGTP diphosphatase